MKAFVKKLLTENIHVFVSLASYFAFFHKLLNPSTILWGDDLRYFFYPVRTYLYESLRSGNFPFWTEKMFSGFPVFAESEASFLNPLNILATYTMGPFISYKVIHFVLYFLGSMSLYYFLKRKGMGLASFVIANFVYFFNFFGLYHQDHQNLIFVMYMLPTFLLVGDHLISTESVKEKAKILILNALVIAFSSYFGGIQMVFMGAIVEVSYICFLSLTKKTAKKIFLTLTLLFIGVLIFSLPLLSASFMLWSKSPRTLEDFSYRKGSLLPYMVVLPFYPKIFGSGDNFYAHKISDDYHEHEIYIYFGISASVLALMGLLTLKNDRFKLYCYFLMWLFFIFGFLRSLPFTDQVFIPFFSLFRYWVRASVFANIGVAFLSGSFVHLLLTVGTKKLSVNKQNLFFLISPLIYFFSLVVMNFQNNEMVRISRFFKGGHFDFGSQFFTWFALLLASLLLIFLALVRQTEKLSKLVVSLFCLLVVFDLYDAGKEILTFRSIQNTPFATKFYQKHSDKRVIWLTDVFANESLYYDSWSIFGYSQLVGKDYDIYLKELGFTYIKRSDNLVNVSYDSLKRLGVFSISDKYYEKQLLEEGQLDVFGNIAGTYLEKKEGHIKAVVTISQNSSQEIDTSIRNYPGWVVKVDGKKVQLNKKPLFLSFNVPQGEHLVELDYVPHTLILGLSVSLLLSAAYIAFMRSKLFVNLW